MMAKVDREADYQTMLDAYVVQVNESRKRIAALEAELKAANICMSIQKGDIKGLTRELAQAREDRDRLTRELAEAREHINEHKQFIQAMLFELVGDAQIDTLEQATNAIKDLRAQLATAQAELAEWKKEFQEFSDADAGDTAQECVEAVRRDFNVVHQALDASIDENTDLRAQLAAARQAASTLRCRKCGGGGEDYSTPASTSCSACGGTGLISERELCERLATAQADLAQQREVAETAAHMLALAEAENAALTLANTRAREALEGAQKSILVGESSDAVSETYDVITKALAVMDMPASAEKGEGK